MINEPLFLPKGSVRAIVSLVITIGLIAGCFLGLEETYIAVLAGLAGHVVSNYFKSRETKEAENER
jgi:hypothetical protein